MIQTYHIIFLLALIVLALACLIWGIILRHHWRTYAPNQALGRLLEILYWSIGGALLTIMAVAYIASSI